VKRTRISGNDKSRSAEERDKLQEWNLKMKRGVFGAFVRDVLKDPLLARTGHDDNSQL
jgi:hypothetical protein